ncbi:hypothetical protein BDW22DRAFT_505723 [Trametopsis cervina]|nr:hypothetical protein BDW22DRAFT_505723 [Trametopsis cervina]
MIASQVRCSNAGALLVRFSAKFGTLRAGLMRPRRTPLQVKANSHYTRCCNTADPIYHHIPFLLHYPFLIVRLVTFPRSFSTKCLLNSRFTIPCISITSWHLKRNTSGTLAHRSLLPFVCSYTPLVDASSPFIHFLPSRIGTVSWAKDSKGIYWVFTTTLVQCIIRTTSNPGHFNAFHWSGNYSLICATIYRMV